ncbi:MAG: DUF3187 family protein [Nitrospira sp.]|nr:DUF3187 family protein [Nitrospira sp.]
MKKLIGLFITFLAFLSFSSIAYSFEGPLQVKNQFPLSLHINSPYLEKASPETSFSVSLSHSSINLFRNSSEWSVGLDMEITELTFRFRKNIQDFIELGIDLPLLSFNSGFMDGFINSYHETFGFPDYGRSNRPTNKFLYEVRKNGVLVIKGESGEFGIGDIRLTAKKVLLNGDPSISLKGDIELPTGNAKKGYGNGSIDAGISALFEKKLSKIFKTYLNFGVIFPGDLKGYEIVKLKTFLYGGAGIESALWKNFRLLGQVFVQGSPLPRTNIPSVDRTAVTLSLGGRYSSGNNSLEFSFTEDPNTAGAPDFTLSLSFKGRF